MTLEEATRQDMGAAQDAPQAEETSETGTTATATTKPGAGFSDSKDDEKYLDIDDNAAVAVENGEGTVTTPPDEIMQVGVPAKENKLEPPEEMMHREDEPKIDAIPPKVSPAQTLLEPPSSKEQIMPPEAEPKIDVIPPGVPPMQTQEPPSPTEQIMGEKEANERKLEIQKTIEDSAKGGRQLADDMTSKVELKPGRMTEPETNMTTPKVEIEPAAMVEPEANVTSPKVEIKPMTLAESESNMTSSKVESMPVRMAEPPAAKDVILIHDHGEEEMKAYVTESTSSSTQKRPFPEDDYSYENGTSDDESLKRRKISGGHPTAHHNRWNDMFQRLLAYKEENGNCLVPNRYPEDAQLGHWVSSQRRQYKSVRMGDARPTAMTTERIAKLSEAGFEWETSDPRHMPWEARYRELREFVQKHGHCEVPMRWKENMQLSNWVSKQRHDYKLRQRGTSQRLSDERFNLLNKIGFVWEAGATETGKKQEFKAFPPPREYENQKNLTGSTGSASTASTGSTGRPQSAPPPAQVANNHTVAATIQTNLLQLLGNPALLHTLGMNPMQLQLAASLLVGGVAYAAVQAGQSGMMPTQIPSAGGMGFIHVGYAAAAAAAQFAAVQAAQSATAQNAAAQSAAAQPAAAQTAASNEGNFYFGGIANQRAGCGPQNRWHGGALQHQGFGVNAVAGRSHPHFPNAMNANAMNANAVNGSRPVHSNTRPGNSMPQRQGRNGDPPGDPPGAEGPANDDYASDPPL